MVSFSSEKLQFKVDFTHSIENNLLSTIYYLLSTIYYLLSTIYYLLSTIYYRYSCILISIL